MDAQVGKGSIAVEGLGVDNHGAEQRPIQAVSDQEVAIALTARHAFEEHCDQDLNETAK